MQVYFFVLVSCLLHAFLVLAAQKPNAIIFLSRGIYIILFGPLCTAVPVGTFWHQIICEVALSRVGWVINRPVFHYRSRCPEKGLLGRPNDPYFIRMKLNLSNR